MTRIPEKIIKGFAPEKLYPEWQKQVADRHEDETPGVCWDDQRKTLVLHTHSWLVQTGNHTVLIDAGIGNDKTRTSPMFDHLHEPYLQHSAAAGCQPADVDYVLLTHLHLDHVGWNTRLVDGRWVPTFPNAKYVFSRAEDEQFSGPGGRARPNYELYEDSVLPVIEAGQAEMPEPGGGEFIDGFFFHPTPGHSMDHLSISLTSRGETAFFAGDVMHLPIQVAVPGLSSMFSADPARGETARRWALEYAAEHRATVFTSHFPGSSLGQIICQRDHFQWQFLEDGFRGFAPDSEP